MAIAYPTGVKCLMIYLATLTQYRRVIDRQTDGRTDGRTDIFRQHTGSLRNAWHRVIKTAS